MRPARDAVDRLHANAELAGENLRLYAGDAKSCRFLVRESTAPTGAATPCGSHVRAVDPKAMGASYGGVAGDAKLFGNGAMRPTRSNTSSQDRVTLGCPLRAHHAAALALRWAIWCADSHVAQAIWLG